MAPIDHLRAPVASRIARARERAGLDSVQVATALGLSVDSYDDLESYDADAFMCISLGQVRALGGILGVSPRELVTPEGAEELDGEITPGQIVARIQDRIQEDAVSVEDFETQVGWLVTSALADPEAVWSDWNLDGLQDICGAIGLNWLHLIPTKA